LDLDGAQPSSRSKNPIKAQEGKRCTLLAGVRRPVIGNGRFPSSAVSSQNAVSRQLPVSDLKSSCMCSTIDFTQPVSELMRVGPTDANETFQDAHQCGMAIGAREVIGGTKEGVDTETLAQHGPILCKVTFRRRTINSTSFGVGHGCRCDELCLTVGLADCASRLARSASYSWRVFIHN